MKKSPKKTIDPVKDEVTGEPIHKKSNQTGKTPSQLMRKHLLDKNNVITEEDFNNLNISLDTSDDTSRDIPPQLLELPADKDRPKDEEKDRSVITPWDVIK